MHTANLEPLSACLRIYAPGKQVDVDEYEVAASVVFIDRQTVEIKGVVTRNSNNGDPLRSLIRYRKPLFAELQRWGVTRILVTRRRPGTEPTHEFVDVPARM